MIAAEINFSSATALQFTDLEGLPSNDTIVSLNIRPLEDISKNHSEQTREEIPGRILTIRAPSEQLVKKFKQVQAPPAHVKERAYPKQVAQECDVERYGAIMFKIDETICAVYEKDEMRKATILYHWQLGFNDKQK